MTKVTRADVEECKRTYPNNDVWDYNVRLANAHTDAVGLPVSVQVAALPYEDEMAIHVIMLLEIGMIKKSLFFKAILFFKKKRLFFNKKRKNPLFFKIGYFSENQHI